MKELKNNTNQQKKIFFYYDYVMTMTWQFVLF